MESGEGTYLECDSIGVSRTPRISVVCEGPRHGNVKINIRGRRPMESSTVLGGLLGGVGSREPKEFYHNSGKRYLGAYYEDVVR